MRTPLPQRGIEQFDQHDSFLFGVLGLVSALAGLDAILEHHAVGGKGSSAQRGELDPGVATDDRVLCALLGVVALRRASGGHLARLALERRRSGEAGVSAAGIPQRIRGGLLR
jgi:hypothetical protein